jgi:phage terminase large subunit-like protein
MDFLYDWRNWGRPNQQWPAGDWGVWLLLCGRGFGKSRTGAEMCHYVAKRYPGCTILLGGRTAGEVRDILIEAKDSGLLATADPRLGLHHEPSKMKLTYENCIHPGTRQPSTIIHRSADKPDSFRGANAHFAWLDELAAYFDVDAAWEQVNMCLRSDGMTGWPDDYSARVWATTTPRPLPLLRALIKDSGVHVTKGTSYDNALNLNRKFYDQHIKNIEGTRLGQQELMGEILEDVPGALWKMHMIDPFRIVSDRLPEHIKESCVAIDPAATSHMKGKLDGNGELREKGDDSNLTGIIVCAAGGPPGTTMRDIEREEENQKIVNSLRRLQALHGYVLADGSVMGSPDYWARKAVRLYHEYDCNYIVAEANQGGEMVRHVIHSVDSTIPVRLVHATKGKQTRAEPVVALYEQGRVHHVGMLTELEDQQLTWDPNISRSSPDRLDALVWGMHSLLVKHKPRSASLPVEINPRPHPLAAFLGNRDDEE